MIALVEGAPSLALIMKSFLSAHAASFCSALSIVMTYIQQHPLPTAVVSCCTSAAAGCGWHQHLLHGHASFGKVHFHGVHLQYQVLNKAHSPLLFSAHTAPPPPSPCMYPQLGAGGTSTFCMASGPQLYAWGKLKVSGDNTTHPTPLEDLSGWNVSVWFSGGWGGLGVSVCVVGGGRVAGASAATVLACLQHNSGRKPVLS
jgi:hypothetical protein